MFNESEITQLKTLFERFTRKVEFTLHRTQENGFGQKLDSFVSEVCRLSDGKCVAIAGEPDPAPVAAPCFKMGAGGCANVCYSAIPMGHQFAPFLKILERIGSGDYGLPSAQSASDRSRAELVVLISDSCPRCPLVVEAAGLSACGDPSMDTFFVDAMQFQEFVEEYKIQSVPATILDRQLVLIGTVSADRIQELVQCRGTPKFEMEIFRSCIEMQNIPEAARRLGGDAGRAVLLELLQDVEFSKRLSALVVLEQALEDNPAAVRAMVPSFLPILSHPDSRVRGDVADLLGKIGDPKAIVHLEPLMSDPDPDVAEAATDAIEELKGT